MSCNSNDGIYFFRGKGQSLIKDNLCNLSDTNLVGIFINVSSEINFQAVRNLVINFRLNIITLFYYYLFVFLFTGL